MLSPHFNSLYHSYILYNVHQLWILLYLYQVCSAPGIFLGPTVSFVLASCLSWIQLPILTSVRGVIIYFRTSEGLYWYCIIYIKLFCLSTISKHLTHVFAERASPASHHVYTDSITFWRISKHLTRVCAKCVSHATYHVYTDSIIFLHISKHLTHVCARCVSRLSPCKKWFSYIFAHFLTSILSKYCQYFLFRTIRVEYFFVASLMMLSKEETVGTYATNGIVSFWSRQMGPENSKIDAWPSKIQMCN